MLQKHGPVFLDDFCESHPGVENTLQFMTIVGMEFLGSSLVITVVDLHIGISPIENFDHDDQLFNVGVDDVLK